MQIYMCRFQLYRLQPFCTHSLSAATLEAFFSGSQTIEARKDRVSIYLVFLCVCVCVCIVRVRTETEWIGAIEFASSEEKERAYLYPATQLHLLVL
jgi:hypothetical protein